MGWILRGRSTTFLRGILALVAALVLAVSLKPIAAAAVEGPNSQHVTILKFADISDSPTGLAGRNVHCSYVYDSSGSAAWLGCSPVYYATESTGFCSSLTVGLSLRNEGFTYEVRQLLRFSRNGMATKPGVSSVADDLALAERHLGSLPDGATWGPNRMMLDRIAEAQRSGRALTVGERNFLLHETTEARAVASGMSQEAAHAAASKTHPTFANYDPAVIKAFPGEFNQAWKNYWGIK